MAKSRSRRDPDSVALIRDFPGLVTNADPNDLAEGASRLQINATAVRLGELRPRGGVVAVKFED